ncbi:hypothetical protein [Lunatibacter salilacus]|uniref:hypothetical protein n=1 Tax=Lunatibacter salilacus TaxID=2483804 RepID=UPI00131A6C9E|nr:hypothetical protein [Lunatibacter salilacus]
MTDIVAMDFNPWLKKTRIHPRFGRKSVNFSKPISAKTPARLVQHIASKPTNSSEQKSRQIVH